MLIKKLTNYKTSSRRIFLACSENAYSIYVQFPNFLIGSPKFREDSSTVRSKTMCLALGKLLMGYYYLDLSSDIGKTVSICGQRRVL